MSVLGVIWLGPLFASRVQTDIPKRVTLRITQMRKEVTNVTETNVKIVEVVLGSLGQRKKPHAVVTEVGV